MERDHFVTPSPGASLEDLMVLDWGGLLSPTGKAAVHAWIAESTNYSRHPEQEHELAAAVAKRMDAIFKHRRENAVSHFTILS